MEDVRNFAVLVPESSLCLSHWKLCKLYISDQITINDSSSKLMRILLRILVKVYKGQWKDCKWVKFQRAKISPCPAEGFNSRFKANLYRKWYALWLDFLFSMFCVSVFKKRRCYTAEILSIWRETHFINLSQSQIANIVKLEAQQYFTRLQYGVPLKMHTTQHPNPTPTSTREITFLAGKVSIHLYTVKWRRNLKTLLYLSFLFL